LKFAGLNAVTISANHNAQGAAGSVEQNVQQYRFYFIFFINITLK